MLLEGSLIILYWDIYGLLAKLTEKSGVSGDEKAAATASMKLLKNYMPCKIDTMGNVVGTRKGEGKGILLEAHIDQIGFCVTAIDEKGFLKFTKCGGADERVLPASQVEVWGRKKLDGVIISVPPHLKNGEEDEKTVKSAQELAIDIGMSKEEAESVVSPGDRVSLTGELQTLFNGNRAAGASIDNRCGVAVILYALKLLEEKNCSRRISVLFSTREETTGSGAVTGSYALDYGEAIAVDVSFADAPGIPPEQTSPMGSGATIGFSPVLSHKMSCEMRKLAEDCGIPFTCEVMGGMTGTDADKVSAVRCGTQMGLVSIPIRNMHTAAEVVDTSDMLAASRLIAEYVMKAGGENA